MQVLIGILLVLFGLILFGLIIDSLRPRSTPSELTHEEKAQYYFANPNVVLKKSCNGGRGAFATRDIKQGEIVEECPAIVDKRKNILHGGSTDNYVFQSKNPEDVFIAFGYGSMFNHNNDHNVSWVIDYENNKIVFTAIKDIQKGKEMFVTYGDRYWETRGIVPKTCSL